MDGKNTIEMDEEISKIKSIMYFAMIVNRKDIVHYCKRIIQNLTEFVEDNSSDYGVC